MFSSKQIYKNLQTKGEQISAKLQILCLSFSVERERPKETFQLKEEEKKIMRGTRSGKCGTAWEKKRRRRKEEARKEEEKEGKAGTRVTARESKREWEDNIYIFFKKKLIYI
jgi:hypothetical protein